MQISRIVLHELQERPETTGEIALLCGLSEGDVLLQLRDLNDRLKRLLNHKYDAITLNSAGTWKADGVAGLMQLNRKIELEVVPKFLDPTNSSWRRDFFVLATLVRTGHLLQQDEISADSVDRGDLATLVARSLLHMWEENRRRPIRRYKRSRRIDFSLDGDVEWESIALPEPDGFNVDGIVLSPKNPFNATIKRASDLLLDEVYESDTVAGLSRLSRSLAHQEKVPVNFPPLPQRNLAWSNAYDLARLVVEGLGLDLATGEFSGPGFVLSTWQSWEGLCYEIVRRALRDHRVVAQERWGLGKRGSRPVTARPDISPHRDDTTDFLLDAKYKVPSGEKPTISRDDLNEAIVFLHASGRTAIDLMYPSTKSPDVLKLGEWSVFDVVEISQGGWEIRGVEVQIQGLSEKGGFDQLVRGTRVGLSDAIGGSHKAINDAN